MTLSLIAALADNRVIGRDNRLPWRLPADLKRFKRLTMGHPLIVGRKTFESIGRPLPGRRMVVLSRRAGFAPEGVEVARGLEEALALVSGAAEVFVGGGAQIYRQALAGAGRLYLTRVRARIEGDRRFPHVDWDEWRLVREEEHPADERHQFPFAFQDFERAGARERA